MSLSELIQLIAADGGMRTVLLIDNPLQLTRLRASHPEVETVFHTADKREDVRAYFAAEAKFREAEARLREEAVKTALEAKEARRKEEEARRAEEEARRAEEEARRLAEREAAENARKATEAAAAAAEAKAAAEREEEARRKEEEAHCPRTGDSPGGARGSGGTAPRAASGAACGGQGETRCREKAGQGE